MNKNNKETVKIIPLGGLEQIGMNITAIEYEDSIIVIDCGLAFPEDDMLGIDLVIPDVTYLKENADKVRGLVVTHGHEDHIGAIPYIEKELNMPIYATKLTMGLIENKLKEHNLMNNTRRKVVKYGQNINLGAFRVEFIRTNHSIADSAALAIYTPAGLIVHTGDFKIDYTPVFGGTIDLQRFAELGKKGVLALMADSTNAEKEGFTQSEKTVGRTFDNLFNDNKDHRIIIATFASNVDRVQQIINSAYKYGRKAVIEGRSMVNIITTASNTLGADSAEVQTAQAALDSFSACLGAVQSDGKIHAPDSLSVYTGGRMHMLYQSNETLGAAIGQLYAKLQEQAADPMKMGAVQGQYSQFNSAQTIISNLHYNDAVQSYQKDVGGFPASVLGKLFGIQEVELFA